MSAAAKRAAKRKRAGGSKAKAQQRAPGEPAARELTLAEFATLVGRTDRQARNWIAEGLPHVQRGKVRVVEPAAAIAWLLEREREAAVTSDAGASTERHERMLKVRAARELIELQLAERRAQLVTAAAAAKFATHFVGVLAGVATGQLQQFERDIVECSSAADARRIRDRIQAALMRGMLEAAAALDARATMMESAQPSTPAAGSGGEAPA